MKAIVALLAALMSAPAFALTSADIDKLWSFEDPVASEARFRAERARWPTAAPRRSRSTRRSRARSACRIVSARPDAARPDRAVDRGRAAARRGSLAARVGPDAQFVRQPEGAMSHFHAALARSADDRAPDAAFYRIDALHMLGIAAPPSQRTGFNRRALAAAEQATEPRARGWRASVLNNLGWSLLDDGDPTAALDAWQQALVVREAAGDVSRIRFAKWAVGRGLPRERPARRGRAHATCARRRDPARRRERPVRAGRARGDREGEGGTMNDAKRAAIFERLREANPAPTTELEHMTPFELLVAVVLSAQSTDKGVNKATAKLYPVANTPAAIAKLGVEGLTPYIASLGLYRNKAKAVVGLSEILVREHGGEVPRDRAALEALPGVGTQDRQRDPQHRVRRAGHRGGHAHLPRGQPDRPRTGEGRRRSGAQARQDHARRVQAQRAPLADPARALHVHREGAEVRRVRDPRPLRVPAEEPAEARAGREVRAADGAGQAVASAAAREGTPAHGQDRARRRQARARTLGPASATETLA
jgi:hypothetical protein